MEINKLKNLDLIDANVVRSISNLANNDKSIMKGIFESFIEDVSELSESAINAKDNDIIKYSIHSIKGLASTLGAKRLAETAKELDNKIKNSHFAEVKQNITELSNIVNLTIDLIKSEYLQ